MDQVCYEEVRRQMLAGEQVMVFVHSRKATVTTALALMEIAKERKHPDIFMPEVRVQST
jgi:replicative superfamily II helicase